MQTVLFALDPNQPAPSWMPIVFLAIPVVIVLAVLIPALRYRARHKKAMRRSRGGVGENSVAIGSAASISDGATYSVEGPRKALAIKTEDHGPTADEPHVYWGTRQLGQVFVRIGPAWKVPYGLGRKKVALP